MTTTKLTAGALAGIVLLVLPGCSAPPKQALIESADEKCRTITQRFAGDLAYGDGIGADDSPRIRERVTLLQDLAGHARKMPKPETGQAELNDWLTKLDTYAAELRKMSGMMESPQVADLLRAMQAGIALESAKEVGQAAKRFGFKDCTKTDNWEHIAS
ncbi:hypothetical protein ACIBEJ_13865 [Nonomuraea sp. NPDC050790]|uniref:hypothetical protein n=1 Tax=Nonomuraea sp. NPDC050790 TaxID=3364371 RepID=UPI003793337E